MTLWEQGLAPENDDRIWVRLTSERMIFGLLIIGGYIGALASVTFFHVEPSAQQILSTGMGVLGTAIGAIVAAIWKTDRADRQQAAAAATLAAKAPDLSSTGTGGALPVSVVNPPAAPVPVETPTAPAPVDAGAVADPFKIKD